VTDQPDSQPISPLRQRMLEDMAMHGLREATQRDYIRFVRNFAAFLRRPPDTATPEDIRRFQVYQAESGVQPPTINCSVSALRFFFTVTLDRPDLSRRLVLVRHPRRLPTVLSGEEVGRLLEAAPGPKYKAALGTAYGPGCGCRRWLPSRWATSTARGSPVATGSVSAMSVLRWPNGRHRDLRRCRSGARAAIVACLYRDPRVVIRPDQHQTAGQALVLRPPGGRVLAPITGSSTARMTARPASRVRSRQGSDTHAHRSVHPAPLSGGTLRPTCSSQPSSRRPLGDSELFKSP